MARPLRIEVAGGFYHVVSHGNGRLWLFRNDGNRRQFLKLLGACVSKYNVVIHVFVLMTTHIHLLVETPLPNLSQFMRKLLSDYGLCYNKRHRRRGSVFKSRYGSYFIQKDNYYLMAVRYLYNNPVKAGLVNDPSRYRWSSLYYLNHRRLAAQEVSWYKADDMLKLVGGKRGLADLTASKSKELPIVYSTFIGDKGWADEMIRENYDRITDDISGGREMKQGVVDVDRIIGFTARIRGISRKALLSGRDRVARKVCLYFLYRYTPLAAQEIGNIFQVSKWAVSQVVHRIETGELTTKEKKIIRMLKMSNVKT